MSVDTWKNFTGRDQSRLCRWMDSGLIRSRHSNAILVNEELTFNFDDMKSFFCLYYDQGGAEVTNIKRLFPGCNTEKLQCVGVDMISGSLVDISFPSSCMNIFNIAISLVTTHLDF